MAVAQDVVTIDGLPAHPLVVHLVVVLIPLSALAVLLVAVRPRWRRRYGGVVAALTVLAVASVPVAQYTGRQLEARLAPLQNPGIEQHAALGETLLPYAVAFGVLVLAFLGLAHLADRRLQRADSARARRGPWRVLLVVLAVLAVLSGALTATLVVRIGHSGADAVWRGVADTLLSGHPPHLDPPLDQPPDQPGQTG